MTADGPRIGTARVLRSGGHLFPGVGPYGREPNYEILDLRVSLCWAIVILTGAEIKTIGIVRCDQPRALDLGARKGKKLESVPDTVMHDVLAKLTPIFE